MVTKLTDKISDSSIPSKLKFVEETVNYIYLPDIDNYRSKVLVTELHLVNRESYNKLGNLLAGNDKYTIQKKDRLFVFPGCTIPAYKLKEYAKNAGAVLVKDIDKATVYLGNTSGLFEPGYDERYQLPDKALAGVITSTTFIPCNDHTKDFVASKNVMHVFDEEPHTRLSHERYLIGGAVTNHFSKYNYCPNDIILDKPSSVCVITNAGLDLIFRILANKIPVISEEHFLKSHGKMIHLDQDLYNSLDMMFNSPSSEDHLTACKILFNCDVSDEPYLIWKLSNKHYYKIGTSDNRRTKDYKLFNSLSKFEDYNGMDEHELLPDLAKADRLTEEDYTRIVNDLSDHAYRYCTNFEDEYLNQSFTWKYTYEEYINKYSK
jgi:hypothetical protein